MEELKSSFTYAAAAREEARRGRKVINLTVGEPPEKPPQPLLEAVERAVRGGFNKYSPGSGLTRLRDAIAEFESERAGARITPDMVVVTAGAKSALMLSILALRPGRMLIIDPYFYAYVNQARLLGVSYDLAAMKLERSYCFDVAGLVSAIRGGRYSAVVINTPHNPTGAILGEDEFREIIEEAEAKGVVIISDEVYADFVYEGRHASLLSIDPGAGILVNSFSKNLFITGWRIGYMIAPRRIAERAAKIAANTYTCPPTPLQAAVAEVLWEAYREARRIIESRYRQRADTLNESFSRVDGVAMPRVRGGLFGFPVLDVEVLERIGGVEEYARRLLSSKGVAVIPGTVFSDSYKAAMRVSLAVSSEEIKMAAKLISEFNAEILGRR